METVSLVVLVFLWVGSFASLFGCWIMMLTLASKRKEVGWVVGLALAHLIVLPIYVITHWSVAKRRFAMYLIPLALGALIFPVAHWHNKAIVDTRLQQIREDPNNTELLQELASALISIDRLGEAKPYLERAVNVNPKDFKAAERLSFLYMKDGKFADAAKTIADALPFPERASKADSEKMYCRLERSLREMGETVRAKRMADALDHDQVTCVDGQ